MASGELTDPTSSSEPDGVSSSVNIELSGVSFTPTDATTKANFSELGLTKLNGSLSIPISYRFAGGAFEMAPTVYVEGFGKLAVGLKLAHLDASALAGETPNLITLLAMANATKVVSNSRGLWAKSGRIQSSPLFRMANRHGPHCVRS
jgi:hypothetical protein